MNKSLISSLLIGSALLLSACGSSRTLDAQISPEYNRAEKYSSIRLVSDAPVMEVPKEQQDYFQDYLQKCLYEEVGFKAGNDLTAKYRFISYNEGSRFQRWLVGGLGGSGKASLIIETSFVNNKGVEIGRVKTQGKIGAGFFGGSVDHALQNAAEEISRYAAQFCSSPRE